MGAELTDIAIFAHTHLEHSTYNFTPIDHLHMTVYSDILEFITTRPRSTVFQSEAVTKARECFPVQDVQVIFYHGSCMDGVFAAACAMKALEYREEKPEYVAVHHNSVDLASMCAKARGKNVAMIDFSVPSEDCERIKNVAKNFFVLDHHETAQKTLMGCDYACIDQGYSGAVLAAGWVAVSDLEKSEDDHLDELCVPTYAEYVGDRDLWQFKLPYSRAIHAAMSYTMDKITLENAMTIVNVTSGMTANELASYFESLANMGQQIFDTHTSVVKSMMRNAVVVTLGQQHAIRVAFLCTSVLVSETGDYLLNNSIDSSGEPADLAVLWWYQEKQEKTGFSFRSKKRPDGTYIDASKIAKHFGGGGHVHAAGGGAIPGPPTDVRNLVTEYIKTGAVQFEDAQPADDE